MKTWDYIIVGTGMGGGPLGLKLSQAGFSVLFIESGRSAGRKESIRGSFAELATQPNTGDNSAKEFLKNGGRWTRPVHDVAKKKSSTPFLGEGVGGSSALYGMVLERFQSSDFKSWPISFQSFEKFYLEAERLFGVRKPTSYNHPDSERLQDFLKKAGLHPYPLPLANENATNCGNCQSMLCARQCKNDSGKICIEPAVKLHGAELRTQCEVLKIETEADHATGVTVLENGVRNFIAAKNVVVSAGALMSPILLINSASTYFPHGLGNDSGLVGHFLMRHYVDLYALAIDSEPSNPHAKELGFNDYYEFEGTKFGTVQSFGRLPPIEVIMMSVEKDLPHKWLLPLFKLCRPLIKSFITSKVKNRLVLASIVEDDPVFENRVWSENGELKVHYQINDRDRHKIASFREKLKTLFKPLGLWFLPSSEKNEMLAHACGTCRMGDHPSSSVLDTENRVHGMTNLFVVDGSFFPTSGGTNPALTIAANSLRVAECILAKAKS